MAPKASKSATELLEFNVSTAGIKMVWDNRFGKSLAKAESEWEKEELQRMEAEVAEKAKTKPKEQPAFCGAGFMPSLAPPIVTTTYLPMPVNPESVEEKVTFSAVVVVEQSLAKLARPAGFLAGAMAAGFLAGFCGGKLGDDRYAVRQRWR